MRWLFRRAPAGRTVARLQVPLAALLVGLLAALLGACTHLDSRCTGPGDPFGVPDSVATVEAETCVAYNLPRWEGFHGR